MIQFRTLWPAALALGLSLGLVAWLGPVNRAARLANLDVEASGFANTFLMFHKTERGSGYVVDRRDSTMRRSDRGQPGRKWKLLRITGKDALGDRWLVQSKRHGKGTVFFVPALSVADWTYPYLYEFVRERNPELALPRVEWTQLHVDRVYQGLYLRVALPFDERKKDGGSGILREILTVQGDRVNVVDTRFDDAPGIYMSAIATGYFPELRVPSARLAWLARKNPLPETVLLMSNLEPHDLSLLPIPISLPELFEARSGRRPSEVTDERARRWSERGWRSADGSPLSKADELDLAAGFPEFARSLRAALRTDAVLHQREEQLRVEFPRRRSAVADLGLETGEL